MMKYSHHIALSGYNFKINDIFVYILLTVYVYGYLQIKNKKQFCKNFWQIREESQLSCLWVQRNKHIAYSWLISKAVPFNTVPIKLNNLPSPCPNLSLFYIFSVTDQQQETLKNNNNCFLLLFYVAPPYVFQVDLAGVHWTPLVPCQETMNHEEHRG